MQGVITFVCSNEFTGWVCGKCGWRFAVDPNLFYTETTADQVVAAFDQHRCNGEARAVAS